MVAAFVGYDQLDQLGIFYVDLQSEHLREGFRAIVESQRYRESLDALLNEHALDVASDLFVYELVGYESWQRISVPEVPIELAQLDDPNAVKKQLVQLTHVSFDSAPTIQFDIEVGILFWSSVDVA